ncbi:HNH endonuclease [Krasilnikovia sp. MM14-A1259]|uniref:HNH endonuclease n=1 Tax=Krasilnikovia sp. MM14-A1259 TaxID=3373539 RepID=UPI003812D1B9
MPKNSSAARRERARRLAAAENIKYTAALRRLDEQRDPGRPEYKAATGEPYIVADRLGTDPAPVRMFIRDHCANCFAELFPETEGLFCSELCQQTAALVRYWRRIVCDGRSAQPTVQRALQVQIAHLLAGGYAKNARRLPAGVRAQVIRRAEGCCQSCGDAGTEIDHIDGDSPRLANLQLLCPRCHQGNTASRRIPATADQADVIDNLEVERVQPAEPTLLCDDEDRWPDLSRRLDRARHNDLVQQLCDMECDPSDFPELSWAELWQMARENADDEWAERLEEQASHPEDYDGGYGPGSYFAHAMARN